MSNGVLLKIVKEDRNYKILFIQDHSISIRAWNILFIDVNLVKKKK